jgi:Electron transfer DM13
MDCRVQVVARGCYAPLTVRNAPLPGPDYKPGMPPDPTTRPSRPAPVVLRLLSVPVVAVVLLGGGWVAGAQLTNNFTASMVLTAAWVGLVGLACLALFLRRREMWPALAAFAVTATAAGAYLGAETLIDDRVDEDVVTAQAPTGAEGAREERSPRRPAPEANVLLSRGRFGSLEHETTGVAQVIELPRGRRVLTLTRFETDNGPDLRVYLSTADANQDSAGEDFVDLGGLKGNVGNQQYEIPSGTALERLTKVVVWCRAFSVGFGAATLQGV